MFRKALLTVLLIASMVVPGWAQPTAVSLSTTACSGTFGAGCVAISLNNQGSVGIQVTGTFVGTLQFEQNVDVSTWVALTLNPNGSTTGVTSTTTTGLWSGAVTAKQVRIRFSAYTSGTAVVSFVTTQAKAGGGGGTAPGGNAPADATYITQVPDATLTAEQALSALATGLLSSTTATGVVSSVTTSAGVAGLISDETGSGALVFGTSPTIATPTIASFTNATHNHTNAAGGGTLSEAALALTDVTTANATSSAHGFMPKLSGNAFDFALGDGTYSQTVARGTITTSSPWTFTQTRNDATVAFQGFDINITTTGAASGARALRVLNAGTETFSVRSTDGLLSAQIISNATTITTPTYQVNSGGVVQFSDGTDFGGSIHRVTGGSGGLRIGNGSTGWQEIQARDLKLVPNAVSQPTCVAGIRGTFWYTLSANGVADKMEVCVKPSTDVYAWVAIAVIP